ncbi:MAG TPA: CGNR zinc finger domain-containing protein [Trebonia sp.]|nr:CGNR zinc finger domain-containing protein [Trebonia sp.]
MSYADYDLNPLNLALDLASVGDGVLSFSEVVREQALMFTDHGYQPGDRDCEATLTRLGAEIAAVLSHEGDEFIDTLSLLLAAYDCRPHLTRHDGVPHLHYARDDAPAAEWMSSMAVSGLVLYVCRNGRERLRRCAAAGCGRWFADTTRNGSRRYCSGTCASRTTVAAFRARQTATGS